MSRAILIRFFGRRRFDVGKANNRIIVFAPISRPIPASTVLLILAEADGLNREVA